MMPLEYITSLSNIPPTNNFTYQTSKNSEKEMSDAYFLTSRLSTFRSEIHQLLEYNAHLTNTAEKVFMKSSQ